MNKNRVLIKALLRSTSRVNIVKNSKDKKRRGKALGYLIGQGVLFLLLMAYCILNCVGFGYFGLGSVIPATCALVISVLSFFLTLFKSNGYLFHFKEYDMLMSLPFEAKNIAACKFMYMYLISIPWYMCVSIAMLVVYGIYEKPSFAVYPVWLVLSMILPLIPMLVAAFLGFLATRISAGFRNKSIAQTVLMTLIVLLCFGSRFFLEDMFKTNKTEEVLNVMSDYMEGAEKLYPPAGWFSGAVTKLQISDMLLLAGISLVLFFLVFIPVGRSYRKINSALQSHASSGHFVMTAQKRRSVRGTIAYKEFKRMTGSATYMTNVIIGEVFCVIVGVAVFFVDVDKLIRMLLKDAPVTKEMLYPAIPFIIYFFVGMVATTAISPSIEGKNYWIVQSLPIEKKTLYQGKMLFNMYLTVPFFVFATLSVCISAKVPLISTLLYLVLGFMLCAFSTAWGCVCGMKHMRLDWENEIEVVKQSSAVAIYLFPNMFSVMALMVAVVVLGMKVNSDLVCVVLIAVVALLALLAYKRAMSLAKAKE